MKETDYISQRRLDRFWDKAKDFIEDKISQSVAPSSDKEIVNVLTYSTTAPESANEGDMYIDSQNNRLLKYDDGEWVQEDASDSVLYVASDTSHIYKWNGSAFVDTTGQSVDDTIFVSNLTTDLEAYTDKGAYNVVYIKSSTSTEVYSLYVSTKTVIVRMQRYYYVVQVLKNEKGYMIRQKRTRMLDAVWSEWEEHIYQEQMEAITEEEYDEICV